MKNITPEQMTVIINIQSMSERIYSFSPDFELLASKDLETLREMQNNLMVHYNNHLNTGVK